VKEVVQQPSLYEVQKAG